MHNSHQKLSFFASYSAISSTKSHEYLMISFLVIVWIYEFSDFSIKKLNPKRRIRILKKITKRLQKSIVNLYFPAQETLLDSNGTSSIRTDRIGSVTRYIFDSLKSVQKAVQHEIILVELVSCAGNDFW